MPPDSELSFRIAGPFAVARDGREIDARRLGSRKGRTLLKLLVVERGHSVSVDRIVEVLWGDAPPSKPEENVASLVSRLRGALGPDVITGGRGGYAFSGTRATVDVDRAAAFTAEAEARLGAGEPGLARAAAAGALGLLADGQILADEPYEDWTQDARRSAARLLRRARRAAWTAAGMLGDHAAARDAAEATLRDDPFDEEAVRAVMWACQASGAQAAALAAYERLRARLADELGADPSPETQRTHVAVLRGEPVEPAAPAAGGRAPAPSRGPFVGREPELAVLREVWAAAASGRPCLVLVVGEAGIGKTTLVGRLLDEARDGAAIVLQARCYEAERSLFLQPVADALGAYVARSSPDEVREICGDQAGPLAQLVPEVHRILRPVYEPAGPEVERRRIFEAVVVVLENMSRRSPVALFFDDLHNAGTSSLELIHYAARRPSAARVLVAATVRAERAALADPLREIATRVDLGPLGHDDIRELAEALGATSEAAEQIARATHGHTLFAVECLREAASAEGSIAPSPPASLQAIVLDRVRTAGEGIEDLLRGAAVLGAEIEPAGVADLLELSGPQTARLLERARDAGLVVESGLAYAFANDLIREALYGSMPAPTRALLHRRAAAVADGPEARAGHAYAAGDDAAAGAGFLEAGLRAAKALAGADAVELLTRGLDAAQRAGDEDLGLRIRIERGRILDAIGRHAESKVDLSAAVETARRCGDLVMESRAMEALVWSVYHARDLPYAARLAREATALPSAGAGAKVLTALSLHSSGELDRAIELLDEVEAADADERTLAMAACRRGLILTHADRYDEARGVLREAAHRCRAAGDVRSMMTATWSTAMVELNLGRFADALEGLARLEHDSVLYGADHFHTRVLNGMAHVYREAGESERARDLALEAKDRAVGPGQAEPRAHSFLALAESALLSGDDAAATEWLAQVELLLVDETAYAWRAQLRHAELWARIDHTRAGRLLELAQSRGSAKYRALALAALGRYEEAAAIARLTRSDWLLARVAPAPEAQAALGRMAAALPEELKASFAARGPARAALASRTRTPAGSRRRAPRRA